MMLLEPKKCYVVTQISPAGPFVSNKARPSLWVMWYNQGLVSGISVIEAGKCRNEKRKAGCSSSASQLNSASTVVFSASLRTTNTKQAMGQLELRTKRKMLLKCFSFF